MIMIIFFLTMNFFFWKDKKILAAEARHNQMSITPHQLCIVANHFRESLSGTTKSHIIYSFSSYHSQVFTVC